MAQFYDIPEEDIVAILDDRFRSVSILRGMLKGRRVNPEHFTDALREMARVGRIEQQIERTKAPRILRGGRGLGETYGVERYRRRAG